MTMLIWSNIWYYRVHGRSSHPLSAWHGSALSVLALVAGLIEDTFSISKGQRQARRKIIILM